MKRNGTTPLIGLALGLTSALIAMSAQAGRTLTGDELNALINDKTVLVTRVKDGAQWRVYFAPDGKQITKGDRNSEGTWWIDEKGNHCNAQGMLKCAHVVDNGDGSYNRVKADGKPVVRWTEIVAGNKL